MKYINTFKNHASYEAGINGGGVDISLPNVSYCEDVKDVHYNPYNTVEFYVGEITPPQTVKIYTDSSTSIDVTVSEGNKWYSYLLQKDKGLYKIEGDSVKKVVIKADISYEGTSYPYVVIIPKTTIEASFKGSNTSNVTSMSGMFYNCRGLTSLDLRNFNTSNVTSMGVMFQYCSGLTSLDLSSFNTSNVTSMSGMFSACNGLTSLDLSNFNTSNVTSMSFMFYSCSGLTSLDLSNFDTSNVTNMEQMFTQCTSLTSLDLSKWDTSKVTDMSGMFYGCTSLTSIRMKGCSEATINKISGVKPSSATIVTE